MTVNVPVTLYSMCSRQLTKQELQGFQSWQQVGQEGLHVHVGTGAGVVRHAGEQGVQAGPPQTRRCTYQLLCCIWFQVLQQAQAGLCRGDTNATQSAQAPDVQRPHRLMRLP